VTLWRTSDGVVNVLINSDLENRCVTMWSSHRLPFEPKGVLLEARNQLRQQLSQLCASPVEILEARFVTTRHEYVDLENVLLYNVGTAAFSASSRSGLRFVRDVAAPRAALDGTSDWNYCHQYCVTPAASIVAGRENLCAEFEFALPKIGSATKWYDYWWAMKHGSCEKFAEHLSTSPFSLRVEISGPPLKSYLGAITKPLFDGIISGFHFDPAITSDDLVCKLLAEKLKVSVEAVAHLLRDDRHHLLGARQLVHPYREFVKCNPADDGCLDGELSFRSDTADSWRIRVVMADLL
jgi:hypothetical protein